jgi:hypothetical protein
MNCRKCGEAFAPTPSQEKHHICICRSCDNERRRVPPNRRKVRPARQSKPAQAHRKAKEVPEIIPPQPCSRCGAVYTPRPAQFAHNTFLCPECDHKNNQEVWQRRKQRMDANPAYKEQRRKSQRTHDHERRRSIQARAVTALNNAIKNGRVQRQSCCICGQPAEGHHVDYSRSLNVIWLCDMNHRQVHNHVKRLERLLARFRD